MMSSYIVLSPVQYLLATVNMAVWVSAARVQQLLSQSTQGATSAASSDNESQPESAMNLSGATPGSTSVSEHPCTRIPQSRIMLVLGYHSIYKADFTFC